MSLSVRRVLVGGVGAGAVLGRVVARARGPAWLTSLVRPAPGEACSKWTTGAEPTSHVESSPACSPDFTRETPRGSREAVERQRASRPQLVSSWDPASRERRRGSGVTRDGVQWLRRGSSHLRLTVNRYYLFHVFSLYTYIQSYKL